MEAVKDKEVEIIGAGFSGLSLAYFFTKKGFKVKIFEESHQVGGLIQSFYENDMLIETAANGFLASKKVEELFQDIDCKILKTKQESKEKFIFRGHSKRWPLTFFETGHLVFKAIKSLVFFQLKPQKGETLKAWCERCLTLKANDYLFQPMVNGIFATSTNKLSAKLVLGSLFFKKEKGSVKGLLSAEKGMNEVITKLRSFLEKQGVKFVLSSESDKKIMYHNTFLAISSYRFKRIKDNEFKKTLSPLQQPINKKESLYFANHLNLLRVTISLKTGSHLKGFGTLFPLVENFNSLGVLVNTNIFENRGVYNESWIMAGSEHPEYIHHSDEKILNLIKEDRSRLSSEPFEIANYKIIRWENVLPIYNQQLEESLENLSESLGKITGNYLGVIGLSGIHERNYQLVEKYISGT